MEGVLAAIITVISFSLLSVVWKDLRNKGVDSSSILALLGFGVPIWLTLGIYLMRTDLPNLPIVYIVLVLMWTLIILAGNFLDVFILRFGGLTELSAYGSMFSVIVALLVDIFWFDIIPRALTYLAIICFFVAGLILSRNRNKLLKSKRKIPLKIVLFTLLSVSLLYTLGIALYKQGLVYQTTILFHLVITQTVLHTTWFCMGAKPLMKDIQNKKITPLHILASTFFLAGGVFGELHAIQALPVTIMVVIGILSPAIFTMFDLKKKEMNVTPLSVGALFLIILGFSFLYLT